MSEGNEEKIGPEVLLANLMKGSTELFENMNKTMPNFFDFSKKDEDIPESEIRAKFQESWEGATKSWKAFSSTISEPDEAKDFLQGISILPEILMKMGQIRWDGFFHLNQQWVERLSRISESAGSMKFDNSEKGGFTAFKDIYEKEFSQFFNIPQIGLTRFYQERFNRALDQSNIFQVTVGEFMFLCQLPIEKSFKVLQDKVAQMAGKGALPENPKDYYNLWIKILEGHYMTLFKSKEYTEALGKTLNALETFSKAKQDLLQDALQALPIPTNMEMDELYKEIYRLNKRVKVLEKESKQNKAKKKAAKKAPVATAPAKKAPAAKAPAKKAPVAKAPAKKAPVATATAKKAPVATATAKKAPAAKAPAKKAPAAKATAKKAPAAKATAKKAPAAKATAKKKTTSSKK